MPPRPPYASDVLDASDDEVPARGLPIMLGTSVEMKTDGEGVDHRRLLASNLTIARNDGADLQAIRLGNADDQIWVCLETRHFGKLRERVWKEEWEHLFRWYCFEEFKGLWPKMESQLNLLPVSGGKVFVPKGRTKSTLDWAMLRELAALPGAVEKPHA